MDEYYSKDYLTAGAHCYAVDAKRQEVQDRYGARFDSYIIDSAAATDRREYAKLSTSVSHTVKAKVYPSIVNLRQQLNNDRYYVLNRLRHTKEEFDGYIWDTKKPDEPIEGNDHLMDCLRYHCTRYFPVRGHGVWV